MQRFAAIPSWVINSTNFSISVSQAAGHWLQCRVRQGLGFWYSKIRLVSQCVGIAANEKCMSGLGLEAAKLSHSNNLIKSTEYDKHSKPQIAYT
jgi:hypothetical protein